MTEPVAAEAATTGHAHRLGDQGDVGRLGTLFALALLELHASALAQRLEAVAGDVAVVDEEILRAFIRSDEAVSLVVVEPLHDSVSHEKHLPCYVTNA